MTLFTSATLSSTLHRFAPTLSRVASGIAAASLFGVIALPSLARAEGVVAEAKTQRPEDWSVGVAVGSSAPLGALGGTSSLVTYGVGVERRMTGPLWLRLGVGASHDRSRWGDAYDSTSLSGHFRLGARVAFADTGPLEWSAVADATVGGGDSSQQFQTQQTHVTSVDVSGALGIAAEARLTDHLSLRLASTVLRGSRGWFRQDDGSNENKFTSGTFGLQLEPSVDLRFYF